MGRADSPRASALPWLCHKPSERAHRPCGDRLHCPDHRLIFVEVKTRSTAYVDPLQSIDTEKQRRLIRAADIFMSRIETDVPLEPQFDLIFIIGNPDDGYSIEHIPDAFYP